MYDAQNVRFHTITEVEKPLKTSSIPIHSPTHGLVIKKQEPTKRNRSLQDLARDFEYAADP